VGEKHAVIKECSFSANVLVGNGHHVCIEGVRRG
jgi:hypothetical protein